MVKYCAKKGKNEPTNRISGQKEIKKRKKMRGGEEKAK